MKPTAQLLGLLLAAFSLTARAEDTPPAPTATVPSDVPVRAEATVTPPAAAPAPFTPLANGKVDDKPADPDVLELPKMVIKQKPRPRLTPEIMVTRQGFGEDLAKLKFSALDQALNKFTLPLFGTSVAERALEEHEREKKAQLAADTAVIAKAVEQIDPAEAKALKDAAARP